LLRRVLPVTVSIASSFLLALSWIWPSLWWTIWIGFSLLFVLATQASSPKRAFLAGAGMGAGAIAIAFHWAPAALGFSFDIGPVITWPLFAVMVAWEAVPFGVLAWTAARQLAAGAGWLWGVPAVWVSMEYAWPRVFPWNVAHSQTDFLTLVQLAEVAGAAGVSFCVMLVAIIPAALVRNATRAPVGARGTALVWHSAIALALLAGVLVFGHQRRSHWVQAAASAPSIRVALVQVEPGYVDSLAKMRDRSAAISRRPDLLCWPESSLGTYCFDLPGFEDEAQTAQMSMPPAKDLQPTAGVTCELLAGGMSFEWGATDEGPFFQTAFLVRPDQTIAARYLKQSLMPIGEYIPGQNLVPGLRQAANLDEIVTAGSDASPLVLAGGQRIGVLMCYEDMVPQNARQSVAEGAQALVCLANGSAFENPVALEQHLRLGLLRSVENRRYLARCTATGVTCVVTAVGEVAERVEPGDEATLEADLPLLDSLTVYNRGGFLFGPGCLVAAVVLILRDAVRGYCGTRDRRSQAGISTTKSR